MKMSKKTRIISIIMCIALMAGILSVGMMATAANNTSAAVYWIDPWGAGPNWDGYVTSFIENNKVMKVETTKAKNMFQLGSWDGGGYTADSLNAFDGATGAVLAVRVDQAYRENGEKLTGVDFVLKLTSNGVCFSSQKNGIAADGTVTQLVYPFTDFKCETGGERQGQSMTEDDINAINGAELDIVSYACNWGNNIKDVKMLASQVFAYTDTPDVISLPAYEPETTTAEPTTEAPTTEAPTTEAPTTEAPTTQAPTEAPTTIAPTTQAPVTQAPVVTAKKPAKVKGVTVKVGKKKVTVKWKAAKNAKKYVVKYSYKKNMKKAKTKTVAKNKLVIKKLKSGKKLYVQVQGVNGKLKGKFSAKKASKKIK